MKRTWTITDSKRFGLVPASRLVTRNDSITVVGSGLREHRFTVNTNPEET